MRAVSHIKGTWEELRQVSWPTKEQTVRLTLVVIALSLAVGAYVGLLDFGFTNLLKFILG